MTSRCPYSCIMICLFLYFIVKLLVDDTITYNTSDNIADNADSKLVIVYVRILIRKKVGA